MIIYCMRIFTTSACVNGWDKFTLIASNIEISAKRERSLCDSKTVFIKRTCKHCNLH